MTLEHSVLLDYATKIGMQAALENITKTQVENLFASLDLVEDPRISFLLVSAFAHRQAARLKKGYNTARIVNELMDKLYRSGESKEKARFVLGLAKWIYEIADNYKLPKISPEINVNTLTFEKFLEILRGVQHR
jgi:hypothetical protein